MYNGITNRLFSYWLTWNISFTAYRDDIWQKLKRGTQNDEIFWKDVRTFKKMMEEKNSENGASINVLEPDSGNWQDDSQSEKLHLKLWDYRRNTLIFWSLVPFWQRRGEASKELAGLRHHDANLRWWNCSSRI